MKWYQTVAVFVGACIFGICAVALAQSGAPPAQAADPLGALGVAAGGGIGGGALIMLGIKLVNAWLMSRRGDDAPATPRGRSDNSALLASMERLLEVNQVTNNLLTGLGEKFEALTDQFKDQRRDQLSQHEDHRRDHEVIKDDVKETKKDVEETKVAVTMLLREKTGS